LSTFWRSGRLSRLAIATALQREKLALIDTRKPDAEAEGRRVRIRPRTEGNTGYGLVFVSVFHVIECGGRAEQQNGRRRPCRCHFVIFMAMDRFLPFFGEHDDFTLQATGQLSSDGLTGFGKAIRRDRGELEHTRRFYRFSCADRFSRVQYLC